MLAFRDTGAEPGTNNVVVLMHGMFGSKGNLLSIGHALSDSFHIVALDLPGHGESPSMSEMSFPNMARAVKELIDSRGYNKVHLIGHSLGGKVAMQIASSYPESTLSVAVLDIAPVDYPGRGHDSIFEAVAKLPLTEIKSRTDAVEKFTEFGADAETAKFILTNLKRSNNGYEWRIDFSLLEKNYENLAQAPVLDAPYAGPALVLKGEHSAYIQSRHKGVFVEYLPNAEHHVVEGAGHWLHAEQPAVVQQHIGKFLAKIV